MLTFFGIKLSYETLLFFALFIGSEVIGNSKLKENSIVQLVLGIIETLKPVRKEDDKLDAIRKILKN